MPIDIAGMAAEARAEYIAVGARYGSEETLAQADATLQALAVHGAALASHGFAAEDATELADARQGLLDGGVERAGATAAKSGQRAGYRKVQLTGKDVRATARGVLLGTRGALVKRPAADARAAVAGIDVALGQTASAGASPTKLIEQLTLLRTTLAEPVTKAAAEVRGGAAAVAALDAAIQALSTATRPAKRGTPEQTELLNIYDGIVVEKARLARHAARAAARKSGTPALAAAFSLEPLAGGPSAAPPAAPPAGPPPPAPPVS